MQIELSNSNKCASVDDRDVSLVSQYRWFLFESAPGYGYAAAYVANRLVLMHRMLLKAKRGVVVDHVDGNGLNNVRSNIRVCSHAENMRNRRHKIGGKFPFKGIWCDNRRRNKRYRACVYMDGVRHTYGPFGSPLKAALAYDKAALLHHGAFARLNFPDRKKFCR